MKKIKVDNESIKKIINERYEEECLENRTYTYMIDVSDLDTSEVTDMSKLFFYYDDLRMINGIEHFKTSQVTNMSFMFSECYNLKELDVSKFNTSNVTDMSYMFENCSVNELDISSFDFSNVKKVDKMFYRCFNLKEIKGIEKLLNSEVYKSLSKKEQYELFEDTKIDLEKEQKKINKKEKER